MTTTDRWEQTAAGVLRGGHTAPGALATVPGPDPRPRADQFPGAASEYRAAWGSSRWAFTAPDGSTAYVDNAEVRATQERLAADGAPVGWLDFPDLGYPPRELRPLYARAIAEGTRTGTMSPAGPDETWQQLTAEHEELIRQWDYDRTPWAVHRWA